jgi:hypothetical protein
MSPRGTGEPSSVLDVAHKRQNNEAVLSLVGPRYAGERRRDQAAALSGKIRLGVPAARGLMWTSAKVRKVYQVCWRWLVGVRTIPIVLTQVCERHGHREGWPLLKAHHPSHVAMEAFAACCLLVLGTNDIARGFKWKCRNRNPAPLGITTLNHGPGCQSAQRREAPPTAEGRLARQTETRRFNTDSHPVTSQ